MENNFRIDSASVSDRGLSNKRPNNEDSFLELNQKGVFAVADGVGGAQAGDVASQMAMEILGEAFNNLKPNEDAEEMMKLAIERANSSIYQMAQDLPQLSTMATTIVALHLSGNIGTIGHVGDSRLYRLDENGNLFRETHDHSVVEEEVRAGRMTVSQAANHPSRNVISRALGAESTVRVDMKTIMFEPNTSFLVCSDGITRHIDDFEIRELLLSNEKAAQICQKMKDICFERGAEDNLTAVIAKVSSTVEGNGFIAKKNDFETPTVTAARTIPEEQIEASNILELDDDLPTAPLVVPRSEHLAPIELDVAPVVASQTTSPGVIVTDLSDEEEVSYTNSGDFETDDVDEDSEETEYSIAEVVESDQMVVNSDAARTVDSKGYEDIEIEQSDFFSKILLGVFTFLIGAIIGAGAIYLYMQNNPPALVPAVPPEKTEDVSLSSFEVLRRNVDENPADYVAKFGNNPRDAEDFFLLGRAYMLTANYAEAKKALIESQNKLSEADEGNAFILANDIAAYIAIIENQSAQRGFAVEIKKGSGLLEVNENESNTNASNTESANN